MSYVKRFFKNFIAHNIFYIHTKQVEKTVHERITGRIDYTVRNYPGCSLSWNFRTINFPVFSIFIRNDSCKPKLWTTCTDTVRTNRAIKRINFSIFDVHVGNSIHKPCFWRVLVKLRTRSFTFGYTPINFSTIVVGYRFVNKVYSMLFNFINFRINTNIKYVSTISLQDSK